jgi:hypothetical protein
VAETFGGTPENRFEIGLPDAKRGPSLLIDDRRTGTVGLLGLKHGSMGPSLS